MNYYFVIYYKMTIKALKILSAFIVKIIILLLFFQNYFYSIMY